MTTTQNKIALVTGGSRGLGKEMALELAKRGQDVIITYYSKKEEAEQVAKEIEALGRKAAVLSLNTGKVESFDEFVQSVSATLKSKFSTDHFDYLVNNAGSGYVIPSFADTTEAQFDELMNVHFKGVFFLTQKLLPFLNDGGGIVNVSSGLTRTTFAGSGAYGSMKSAIETLTRYLAFELGGRGIRANIVAPGIVPTDFSGGRLRNNPNLQEHIKSITALKRLAQPDDIAGVVAFLCSDDSKWVTAQRIEASGGLHL
ncbi:short-chain dehydrogenase [Niastella koreensis]|uniref:3-oxoacyl-(Acyl-carrier-protein) reductase n=2 Tax=Niastella koreensis TaxID=354356 RepID=G8T7Z4_NIAKG|nr:SDR family oxidoreductase [Niastella koreensis]AEV96932.1 3-oxoacyl-(acyl-carrier-protein) reductase [Niastella koreensis GR20-10]OQP39371.1 short-chain dehydrogenase [Niastella koreensis]